METLPRLCLACNKIIKGRADKKFCDDYCRNAFNNKSKTEESVYIKQIIQSLKKNRKILEELMGKDEMKKCAKATLTDKGFQFRYHTHEYKNKKGNIYYFCFEYGYLPLESDWYLIVKRVP